MAEPTPLNVTLLLDAAQHGDAAARDRVLTTLYDELRRLAMHLMNREAPNHTLQATALVHEAYLQLVDSPDRSWKNRRHFVNAAALAMRHLLVDRARRCAREKHGGGRQQEPLEGVQLPVLHDYALDEVEALDAALQALGQHNERWLTIAHLRYFAGLTVEQVAEALDLSVATVKSDWQFARAWLKWRLESAAAADETA